jgi:plastocyanin
MRKFLVLALAVALLGALAATAIGATRTVKVGDVYLKPKTMSVAKGTKIKWTWVGSLPHNVTVKKGPVKFHSPTQKSGTFTRTLKRRGTYVLYCTVHGFTAQHQTIKVG